MPSSRARPLRIAEHQGGQRRPVERAVGGEHRGPELRSDRGESGRAGRDDLAGQPVGVDDHGAELAQQRRHGGLARSDTRR